MKTNAHIFLKKIALICFVCLCFYSNSQYIYKEIKTDLISSNYDIFDIKIDGEHNIWIATEKGLTKYNGDFFKTFTTKEGLSSNEIYSIFIDNDTVWLNSIGDYICYIYKDKVKQVKIKSSNGYTRTLKLDKIYLQGESTFSLNNDSLIKLSHGNYHCSDIYGNYLKIPYDKNYFIISNLKAKDTSLISSEDYTVRNRHNEIIAFTDIKTNTKVLYKTPNGFNEIKFPKKIEAMQASNQFIYIKTEDSAYVYNRNADRNYVIEKYIYFLGIENSKSIKILEDNEGNIWIASQENGLYFFPFLTKTVEKYKINLSKHDEIKVIGKFNSSIYYLLENGDCYKYDSLNNTFKKAKNIGIKVKDGVIKGDYFLISNDGYKNICVSENPENQKEYGIIDFKLIKDTILNSNFFTVDNISVKKIYVDSNKAYIGHSGGVLMLTKNNNLIILKNLFENERISEIQALEDTLIYYSLNKLVYSYPNANKEVYSLNNISAFFKDNNTLYLGIKDEGILVLNSKGEVKKRIKTPTVNGIKKVNNKIFYQTDNSIFFLDNNTVNSIYNEALFFENDKVVSFDLIDGDLWIATTKNIYKTNSNYLSTNYPKPTAHIINSYENGENIKNIEKEKLKYGSNISLNIGSHTLYANNSFEVFYKTNTQKEWNKANAGLIKINDLNDKLSKLSFYVIENGQKSDVKIINLYVITPLWKTIWFWIFLLVFLAVILFAIVKITERYRYKKLKQKYSRLSNQIKAVQARMNPHFLFNSLSTFQNLYLNKSADEASDFLSDFSDLLRDYMDYSEKDFINLEEEIILLKRYLLIEKERYQERLNYEFFISADVSVKTLKIPTWILQPSIENAILHGISNNNNVTIKISINKDKNNLLLTVIDDGPGISETLSKKNEFKKHNSIATNIIKDKINIINQEFHEKISYTISDLVNENKQGTKVEFLIPNAICLMH